MTDAAAASQGGSVIGFSMSHARIAEVRLGRALAALQRATDQQATELAAWRATLVELDRRLAGLAGRSRARLSEDAGPAGALDRCNPRAMPGATR